MNFANMVPDQPTLSGRPVAQDYDISLSDGFKKAMELLKRLESGDLFSTSDEFKRVHLECLETLVHCMEREKQLGLFSPNDIWDDIQTPDIRYLNLNFYVAKVLEKSPINTSQMSLQSRINALYVAIHKYLEFLSDLGDLRIDLKPSRGTAVALTQYIPLDVLLPRGKYSTFELKRLKAKTSERTFKTEITQSLRLATKRYDTSKQDVPVNDEERIRAVEADRLALHWHATWEAMVSLVGELDLLTASASAFGNAAPAESMFHGYVAPTLLPQLVIGWSKQSSETFNDVRMRMDMNTQSDRSTQVEQPTGGALTSKNGKVRRPFVIMPSGNSNRVTVSKSIFGTGQRLPTISIEELIERELAHQATPEIQPVIEKEDSRHKDDDNDTAADILTMKARRWDDFTEENARGSGNTLNLG